MERESFLLRSSKIRLEFAVLCLLFDALLLGCTRTPGDLVPVQGHVTWQGQPVTIGKVLFMPFENEGEPAIGLLSEEGSFQLTSSGGRTGVMRGRYMVCVEAYTGAHIDGNVKYIVPKQYANPQLSGLTIEVTDETSHVDFELPQP